MAEHEEQLVQQVGWQQTADIQQRLEVEQQQQQVQLATQQAALAVEPFYHDPPRHIDIQAAIQERNRREQEWIQRMHEMWRNEHRAEEQMQLDEQEELQHISIADQIFQGRMRRLDEVENHMSGTQVEQYRA